jgi:hypothetical protein
MPGGRSGPRRLQWSTTDSLQEVAQLEQHAHALEQRVARLSAENQTQKNAACAQPPVLPGEDWAAASRHVAERVAGSGSSTRPAGSASHVMASSPELAHEEMTLQVLRRLASVDRAQAIAAVDELVASARAPSTLRTAMLSMALLAETDEPAIDRALWRYGRAESRLLRLHAAKLLERRGDNTPLASVVAEAIADLASREESRKVQALAVLGLAGAPTSAAQVKPLLHDPSSAVRRGAILALRRIDDGSLRAALTPLLKDPDPRVQAAAENALGGTP